MTDPMWERSILWVLRRKERWTRLELWLIRRRVQRTKRLFGW